MKKSFMFLVLLMMGVMLVGCSNDSTDSSVPPANKKADEGKADKDKKPALVFFFNEVNSDVSKSQLVELQKNKKLFSKFHGDIYAVSRATKEQHNQLKKELQLDFTLVSDPELKISKKAKLVDKSAHQSLNGYAIFDKKGNVIYKEEVNTFGEEAEGIIYFALQQIDDKK